MSGRVRTVLMAVCLLMIAYALTAAISPQSLTPTNEAIAVVFAFVFAVILERRRDRRRGEDEDDGPFASDGPRLAPGRALEEACEDALRSLGWHILPVSKSRDGGADIHATKNKLTLVVQCKDYKRPVGLKAVQEVHFAAAAYRADHRCVVAPNGFSNDARKHARNNKVMLLTADELPRYARSLA